MKEVFVPKKFQAKTLRVVEQANTVIAEYDALGFILTLRQLFYQFVARELLANTQQSYKRLGWVLSEARLAGEIDWDAIEDRTRETARWQSWSSPSETIEEAARTYAENPWLGQKVLPFVWIEKSALVNVIEDVCSRWHVAYFACRGFSSQTELYNSGREFQRLLRNGITPIVLHLGDHDPSGIFMTRDNAERLELFTRQQVEVRRIALNLDQVRQLPPNPAKENDSRYGAYIKEFGTPKCWELDALDPSTIAGLVDREIKKLVNKRKWQTAKARELRNRGLLQATFRNWIMIENFLAAKEKLS